MLAIGALLLIAAALRAIPWLAGYPLHPDEALYGAWARLIASGRDPLLLTAWIDKPPLVPYLLAASLRLFSPTEVALRLPGMVAGIALSPAVFGLGCRAYGRRVAALGAALVAVSPFAILFSPTAFTDPWWTLFLVVAAWATLSRRPFWAGVATGLAVASKQQGVLAIPLVIGLWAMTKDEGRRTNRVFIGRSSFVFHRWWALLLGFALVFAPVTYWDSLRFASRPSFWDRSLTTYGGLGLTPVAQWPDRMADWAAQLGYLFGSPALSALMWGLAAIGGMAGLSGMVRGQDTQRAGGRPPSGRAARVSGLVLVFVVLYLALHFFVTFRPWDRYLLPLLPLVCLLAARGMTFTWDRLVARPRLRATLGVALALWLAWSAGLGATGRMPVGSDHGAHSGIERVAALIRGQPANAILYHRSLGWHFDFYLFDAPQERRWWDSATKLAADASRTTQAEPPRSQWLVVPAWEAATRDEAASALDEVWLALSEAERFYRRDGSLSFVVYQIVPKGSSSP